MKVCIVDFYDSFTYNLQHYIEAIGHEVDVWYDHEVDIDAIATYDAIILSPGPGIPSECLSIMPILKRYGDSKRILGVCLGMQGLVEFFGGSIYNLEKVRHGIQVDVHLQQDKIWEGLPSTIQVGLYHSWACALQSDGSLTQIAEDAEGVCMAVRHSNGLIYGVQFHPESILTPMGKEILQNFLR